jgi:hypothetical protein
MGVRRSELCELLTDYCMGDLLNLYETLKDELIYEGIDIQQMGSPAFLEIIMDHIHFDAQNKSVEEVMSE